jgi:hypothetical protein
MGIAPRASRCPSSFPSSPPSIPAGHSLGQECRTQLSRPLLRSWPTSPGHVSTTPHKKKLGTGTRLGEHPSRGADTKGGASTAAQSQTTVRTPAPEFRGAPRKPASTSVPPDTSTSPPKRIKFCSSLNLTHFGLEVALKLWEMPRQMSSDRT